MCRTAPGYSVPNCTGLQCAELHRVTVCRTAPGYSVPNCTGLQCAELHRVTVCRTAPGYSVPNCTGLQCAELHRVTVCRTAPGYSVPNCITAYVAAETAEAIQRIDNERNMPVSHVASELLRLGATPAPRQAPPPPPAPSWANTSSPDYDPERVAFIRRQQGSGR